MSDKEKLLGLLKKDMEEEGLAPVIVKNKKTGEIDLGKTVDVTLDSLASKLDRKLGQKFRTRYINIMERRGIDMTKGRRSDRVAQAEKKIRMKKVTGPELTTPQKKAKGGMVLGPSYRHGHKDLRKSGLSKRMK
tara:strand:+ start:573 stop:974 length:402 start_codon:yes stop_codon:yes gene_type:complete